MENFVGELSHASQTVYSNLFDPSRIKQPFNEEEKGGKAGLELDASLEQQIVPKVEACDPVTDLKTSIRECVQLVVDSKMHILPKEELTLHVSCDHCRMKFLNKEEVLGHFTWSCLEFSPNYSNVAVQNNKFSDDAATSGTIVESACLSTFQKKSKPLLTCFHCNRTFRYKGELRQHMLQIHFPFCDICLKLFRTPCTIALHKKKFHKDIKASLECKICKRTFSTYQGKAIHEESHKYRDLSCKICGKKCSDGSVLKIHQIVHTVGTPFKCEFCEKLYKYDGMRKAHQLTHFDVNKCTCDDCWKVFSCKRRLAVHVRNHFNNKPYVCEICSMSFRGRGERIRHMTIHSDEKPFGCEFCERKFKRKQLADLHKKIHSSEKRFACELCGMMLASRASRRSHAKHHIKGLPFNFKCEVCGQRFQSESNLSRHTNTKHSKMYECNVCGIMVKYLDRHIMTIHSNKKSFGCEFCELKFKRKQLADLHKKIHSSEKRFACELCGMKLASSASMRSHAKHHVKGLPFNFKCEVCSQLFQSESNLSRHTSAKHSNKYKCDVCGAMVKYLNRHISFAH